MEEMSDVEKLIALEEIKLLKARRDHAVDMKDWTTFEALHAPDHRSKNEGFKPWTRAELVATVRRLNEHLATAHHSHTSVITLESRERATGVWAMEDNLFWKQGDEEHWAQGFGFYHETYEKRDGHWVFTSRQLKRTHTRLSPGAKPPWLENTGV